MIENKLLNFINTSPTCFNVVSNLEKEFLDNDYIKLKENEKFILEKGKKYFIKRNNSSLIAFTIGKNINENYSYKIVASHTDSPCFKLKPRYEGKTSIYNKINIEPYGGMINSTWLDRPLSIAGRIIYKDNNEIKEKIINIDKPCLMIPNKCIHFVRDMNNGHIYNYDKDLQPFYTQEDSMSLLQIIENETKINKNSIINFDLFTYNYEKGYLWGNQNEYISCSRLDDLECVFISKESLLSSKDDFNINVACFFNNEEVGSLSYQGAESDFLIKTLTRINNALSFDDETFNCAISKSFILSCDNAHAVHPNDESITDRYNQVFMNKGVVIKSNAKENYISNGLSSSIVQIMCEESSTPYQFFANRSDIPGGSTLGNFSNNQVSILGCDIGLSQLAMHSSFETAGSKDIQYLYNLLNHFYSNSIPYFND